MSGFTDQPGGNLANAYLSKVTVSYPLSDKPNNKDTAQFELVYYQFANAFITANVGSTSNDAPNAYLFEQGPKTNVGAGVISYTRSYIQQPVTWYDLEQVQYNYPGLDSNIGGGANWVAFGARYAVTVQKLATVKHEYTINANVPFANVANVTIVTLRGQPINRIGQGSFIDTTLTVPNTDPSLWVLSSDPQRWKGNLWEVVTKTVGFANVFYP